MQLLADVVHAAAEGGRRSRSMQSPGRKLRSKLMLARSASRQKPSDVVRYQRKHRSGGGQGEPGDKIRREGAMALRRSAPMPSVQGRGVGDSACGNRQDERA